MTTGARLDAADAAKTVKARHTSEAQCQYVIMNILKFLPELGGKMRNRALKKSGISGFKGFPRALGIILEGMKKPVRQG